MKSMFYFGVAVGAWVSWFAVALMTAPIAQPTTPGVVVGCVYNATPPTLSDRQTGVLQCDSAGRLKVVTTP